jgi:hypothetical protein
MNEILIANSGLIPVITALVEAAKQSGMPVKFAPLASIVTGMIFSFLISWATLPLFDAKVAVLSTVIGVITGLAASGLYAGVKTYGNNDTTASTSKSEA